MRNFLGPNWSKTQWLAATVCRTFFSKSFVISTKTAKVKVFSLSTSPNIFSIEYLISVVVDNVIVVINTNIYQWSTCLQSDDETSETSPLTNTLEKKISSLIPAHILNGDVHIYSLNDLLSVKAGKMLSVVREVVDMATHHLNQCQVFFKF